ncbi:MAG: regulatory protein RecX [Gammaproteobacteria bacterium]
MSDDAEKIRELGLRLLAHREHSRLELANKLTLRGFNSREVELVLSNFVKEGWLNDIRFSENYARQRIQKGYGPIRIAYELKQAGIDNYDLDGIIEATAGSWLALLVRVYDKKYTHLKKLTRQEWARRCRFLQQRGFSGDLIRALFDYLNLEFEETDNS